MNYGKTLAIIQIVISIAAAVAYGCDGDTRRAIYWAAGAVLVASVTF